MIRTMLACLLALFALPATAQTAVPVPAPSPAAAPLPRVALVTSEGTILVEADIVRAPITAKNFLRYVDTKKLDGVDFYRVVKVQDHYGLVQFGARGAAGKTFPPIAHEPTTQTGIKHMEGTLSMARNAPGSARGEFTIMIGEQTSLDADPARPGDNLGYAAFGHVVEGMEVVMKILDAPVSPTASLQGAYQGQVPVAPVKILTARRVSPQG